MVKKTLYMHIGYPKTGSSAIQALLAINSVQLLEDGIFYPEGTEFSQAFQTSCGNCGNIKKLLLAKEYSLFKKEIDKQFKSHKCVLYSNEELIQILSEETTMKNIFEVLGEYNVILIIYIRFQVDYINSLFNQQVKNHDRITEPEETEGPNYYECLTALSKQLPKENIIVRVYEKTQFMNGNIFDDFLNCLGVEFSSKYVLPEKIVNPSLNMDTLNFRIIANKTQIDQADFNKTFLNGILSKYTVEHGGGTSAPIILSEAMQLRIKQHYDADNTKLAKEFLNRCDGKLFFGDEIKSCDNKDLNADNCLNICRFILRELGKPNIDDIINYYLVEGVMETLYERDRSNYEENFKGLFDLKFRHKKDIRHKPSSVSKDISSIKKRKGKLYIESSSIDPWLEFHKTIGYFGNNILVRIEMECPKRNMIQVFYKSVNNNFMEGNSRRKFVEAGYVRHAFFIESEFLVKSLRIDFGNIPGQYVIHKLDIIY